MAWGMFYDNSISPGAKICTYTPPQQVTFYDNSISPGAKIKYYPANQ